MTHEAGRTLDAPVKAARLLDLSRAVLGRERPGRRVIVRPDDRFIVSYPKSGNTWVRFLLASLANGGASVDFLSMERLVPDIYLATARELSALPSPRILKSHEYFDPRYGTVLYVVRDPRDVLVSYFHHQRKTGQLTDDEPVEAFAEAFLDGTVDDYGTWQENVVSWTCVRRGDPGFKMVRYEELRADPIRVTSEMAEFLGLNASRAAIARAVGDSTFARMKGLEREQGRLWRATRKTRQDLSFMRSGAVGEGKAGLPEGLERRLRAKWGRTMADLGYT